MEIVIRRYTQLAPVIGVAGTSCGMIAAFATIGLIDAGAVVILGILASVGCTCLLVAASLAVLG